MSEIQQNLEILKRIQLLLDGENSNVFLAK